MRSPRWRAPPRHRPSAHRASSAPAPRARRFAAGQAAAWPRRTGNRPCSGSPCAALRPRGRRSPATADARPSGRPRSARGRAGGAAARPRTNPSEAEAPARPCPRGNGYPPGYAAPDRLTRARIRPRRRWSDNAGSCETTAHTSVLSQPMIDPGRRLRPRRLGTRHDAASCNRCGDHTRSTSASTSARRASCSSLVNVWKGSNGSICAAANCWNCGWC